MTASPSPRAQAPDFGAPAPDVVPGRLSTTGWSRLRRSVTTAVFVVATVGGVVIGVRAVDVSPVAPPVAAGELPASLQHPGSGVDRRARPTEGKYPAWPSGDLLTAGGPW